MPWNSTGSEFFRTVLRSPGRRKRIRTTEANSNWEKSQPLSFCRSTIRAGFLDYGVPEFTGGPRFRHGHRAGRKLGQLDPTGDAVSRALSRLQRWFTSRPLPRADALGYAMTLASRANSAA